jgi:hypothetical protein
MKPRSAALESIYDSAFMGISRRAYRAVAIRIQEIVP